LGLLTLLGIAKDGVVSSK
jgi:hypothetical protein